MACRISILCFVFCALSVVLCEQGAAARGTHRPLPASRSPLPLPLVHVGALAVRLGSRLCCLALMCAARCVRLCGKPKMVITQQVRRPRRTAFDTSRQEQEAADNPQHGSSLYDQHSRQHHVAHSLRPRKGETRIALGDPLKGRPWVHDSFCDTRGRSGLCFFPSSKKKRHQYRFRCHQTSILTAYSREQLQEMQHRSDPNGDNSASTASLAHCLRHQPTGARSGGQSTTREQPLRPTLAPTPRRRLTAPTGETRIALGDPLKGQPWVHDSLCDTRGRSGLCFFPSSKKKRHQYRFRCHQTSTD